MDMKKKIAIMYDFDGTLAPVNMQEYSFIPEVKMQPRDFWEECSKIGEQANMDSNLAYMYFMTQKAKETGINITKESFYKHGKDITYFNGVETWFKRINEYAASLGLEVEHYIISCGNTEILKGCSIAHASTLMSRKFLVIRCISDNVFLSSHVKVYEDYMGLAIEKIVKYTINLFSSIIIYLIN